MLLSYVFKIVSDGIIAGAMIRLLYVRSRGVRPRYVLSLISVGDEAQGPGDNSGRILRVVRDLIYWAVSTGIVLWSVFDLIMI
jgi:hypothetical protein